MPRTILLASGPDLVIARRVRVRDRLAARLRVQKLDLQLAAGAEPDASPSLALRAQALLGHSLRVRLALQLRRVLREAERPQRISPAAVPVSRPAVLEAAEDLELLAERLLDPSPVAVKGIARTRLLLTDGASPLYWRTRRDALVRAARRALEGLDLTVAA
jgi:hypothetical protein